MAMPRRRSTILAAATGMNRPSLYAAFGDKHDLYLKTLERYQQRSRAGTVQLLADDPTLRVFLRRFYEGALDIYRAGGDEARGCYSISTAPAQATTDPAVRAFLAASIGGTDAFLSSQIAKARERGEVPSNADPATLAQLATATLTYHRGALSRRGAAQATGVARRGCDRSDLWAGKILIYKFWRLAKKAGLV